VIGSPPGLRGPFHEALPGFTRLHSARRGCEPTEIRNNHTPHHLEKSQEVKMRMAMLAIVATLGAAALAGPAGATALMDMPATNAAYQTVAPTAGCPADSHWVPGRYDRWTKWQPGHCVQG
jgi:hypothetical protein